MTLCQKMLNTTKSPKANSSSRGLRWTRGLHQKRLITKSGAALVGDGEPDGLPLSVGFNALDTAHLSGPAPTVNGHGDLLPPRLEAAFAPAE